MTMWTQKLPRTGAVPEAPRVGSKCICAVRLGSQGTEDDLSYTARFICLFVLLMQTEEVYNTQEGQIQTKRTSKWVTVCLKMCVDLGE